MAEANVHVFVEAPVMSEHDSMNIDEEPAGSTCVADLALQTADTQKLERIHDEPATDEPIKYAQDDTRDLPPVLEPESLITPVDESSRPIVSEGSEPSMEIEPEIEVESAVFSEDQWAVPVPAEAEVKPSSMDIYKMNETMSPQPTTPPRASVFSDSLLDLDDFDSGPQTALADDLVLDLDYQAQAFASSPDVSESVPEPAAVPPSQFDLTDFEPATEEPAVAPEELHEWTAVAEHAPEISSTVLAPVETQASADPLHGLSAEAVDAIARRVVEQLSEKVVREIAWEVVPDLAELLIRQKLEEQK
jgi:hypothetical protein